jgi:peptidoglycan/xylan/chitin deacetylase (PgdA/CDA1 family)
MRPLLPSAALAGAIWSLPALAPVVPSVADALRLPRMTDGTGAEVALTFDDGPDPAGTPVVLEILARLGATATFFCVGEQIEASPSLVREIDAAGHGLALHGHRHCNQLLQTPRALREDLDRARFALGEALGREPEPLYRPPFGIFSAGGLRVVRGRGLRPVLWSRWGHDWRALTNGRRIAHELLDGAIAGDILLAHDSDRYSARDSWRRTAEALPIVLGGLQARGLSARRL